LWRRQVLLVIIWPVILSWAMLWVPLGGWKCAIDWQCDDNLTYTNITRVIGNDTIVIGTEENAPVYYMLHTLNNPPIPYGHHDDVGK
jgi:hypothetical protein